jgi:hypothetical protein
VPELTGYRARASPRQRAHGHASRSAGPQWRARRSTLRRSPSDKAALEYLAPCGVVPISVVARRSLGVAKGLNLEPLAATYLQGNLSEAVMTHWRNTMVDRPETDGAVYVMGWTISGLAVLGAVVAVWVFGI